MIDTLVPRLCRALAAVALAALLLPSAARAQLATTNLQALHGWGFQDSLLGLDTGNEQLTTLTVNHFSTWRYGDHLVFVDLYRGDLPEETESMVYAEWHPRLFINRLLGTKGNLLGVFREFGLAFEVNQGHNFYAYMAGVGGDLALPVPGTVSLNLFYRYDSAQLFGADVTNHTWQVSPSWVIPFGVGPASLLFAGFVDVSGANDNEDVDVLAQPQLLVDVLRLAGGPEGKLWAGLEWYLHYNEAIVPDTLVSAPQAMVQWTLH